MEGTNNVCSLRMKTIFKWYAAASVMCPNIVCIRTSNTFGNGLQKTWHTIVSTEVDTIFGGPKPSFFLRDVVPIVYQLPPNLFHNFKHYGIVHIQPMVELIQSWRNGRNHDLQRVNAVSSMNLRCS